MTQQGEPLDDLLALVYMCSVARDQASGAGEKGGNVKKGEVGSEIAYTV